MRFLLIFLIFLSCGENLSSGNDIRDDPSGPSEPQPSNNKEVKFSGKLYFSNATNSSSSIIELDGSSKAEKYYTLNSEEHMPFVAANTVYFTSRNNLSFYNIYSINRSTNSRKNVFLRDYNMFFPRLSPDGKYWAWVNTKTNSLVLHRVSTQSDSIIRVGTQAIRGLNFMPNSSALLFHEEFSPNPKLYSYNFATKAATLLADGRYADASSDGSTIVYSTNKVIWEMNLATKAIKNIHSSSNLSNPVYSPDDSEIAFTEGAGSFQLRLINRDGTNLREFPSYQTSDIYLFWGD